VQPERQRIPTKAGIEFFDAQNSMITTQDGESEAMPIFQILCEFSSFPQGQTHAPLQKPHPR
jgi:hypothetical protein